MPCKHRQNAILPWDPNSWSVEGSEWSLVEEFEEILCYPNDHYNLAIPLKMSIHESMDTCNHKLNNSIIPFPQDLETFHKYVTWYKNTTGGTCSSMWAPVTDENSEGIYLNMNSNAVEEFLPWDASEPNGGKDENFVRISVSKGGLLDASHYKISCSSCLLSSSLLLQLDGLCEHSMIGNLEIKSNDCIVSTQKRTTRS